MQVHIICIFIARICTSKHELYLCRQHNSLLMTRQFLTRAAFTRLINWMPSSEKSGSYRENTSTLNEGCND